MVWRECLLTARSAEKEGTSMESPSLRRSRAAIWTEATRERMVFWKMRRRTAVRAPGPVRRTVGEWRGEGANGGGGGGKGGRGWGRGRSRRGGRGGGGGGGCRRAWWRCGQRSS